MIQVFSVCSSNCRKEWESWRCGCGNILHPDDGLVIQGRRYCDGRYGCLRKYFPSFINCQICCATDVFSGFLTKAVFGKTSQKLKKICNPRVCQECVKLWQNRRHAVWCVSSLCRCSDFVDYYALQTWTDRYQEHFLLVPEAVYIQKLTFLPTSLLDIIRSFF